MNDYLAIVPAYNEQGSVGQVVEAIHRDQPQFDVLVVDDGSTDATAARAHQAGAAVLIHPYNLGIGGAMQSGYRYALDHAYERAVQIDGDGQHDPNAVSALMASMSAENVDMVCGSRFVNGGAGYKSSAGRRFGIRLFAMILSAISRQRVTDPTSGFRLCNRRAIDLFARDYPHDYPEVEAVLMVKAHSLSMAEVSVPMKPRLSGKSSITFTQGGYYMFKVLLALFIGMLRKRPEPAQGADLLAS